MNSVPATSPIFSEEDPRKEYQRNYQKLRKQALKDRGICLSCQKTPVEEGRTCCAQCLEDKKLAAKFGVSGPYRQLYADLFERQGGLCGVCKEAMRRPVLNHDRITMEVRGLLCNRCNTVFTLFKDSSQLLEAARRYIETSEGIGIKIKKRNA